MRDVCRWVMQALINTEATEQIDAARYEPPDVNVTERDRRRLRPVAAQDGDI